MRTKLWNEHECSISGCKNKAKEIFGEELVK